jgi:D-alanine-D-alanine ligase
MRITVLTGGTSSERDVAIASAVQVIGALRGRGHSVAVVDTARGLIPEAEESRLLSASVGKAPPAIEELVALERGVLLSGLASLPVIRDAEVLFLASPRPGEDGTLQAVSMGGVLHRQRRWGAACHEWDIAKRLFRVAGATADWLMTPPARKRPAGGRLALVVKPCEGPPSASPPRDPLP